MEQIVKQTLELQNEFAIAELLFDFALIVEIVRSRPIEQSSGHELVDGEEINVKRLDPLCCSLWYRFEFVQLCGKLVQIFVTAVRIQQKNAAAVLEFRLQRVLEPAMDVSSFKLSRCACLDMNVFELGDTFINLLFDDRTDFSLVLLAALLLEANADLLAERATLGKVRL